MTVEERVELLAIDRYLAERNRPAAEDDEAAAQERRADFLVRLAEERRRIHGDKLTEA